MTHHIHDKSTSTDIARHFLETADAAPITQPEHESLDDILKRAAQHRMTSEEIRAQRISFAYGQLMDCAPQVTREQVSALHDEIYAAPITAHYIPAVDYVRADWQNGTLARVSRKPRRLWPFLVPLAALLSLALAVAIWGRIG